MELTAILGTHFREELDVIPKTGDGLFCAGQNGVDGVFTPHDRKVEFAAVNGQVLCRVNRHFLTQHDISLRETWDTESMSTAINLVDRTPCFTTVPALCKRMDYLPPNLVLMELGDPPLEWEMAIVYPKKTRITRIMRLFIDLVKEYYHSDPQIREHYRMQGLNESWPQDMVDPFPLR